MNTHTGANPWYGAIDANGVASGPSPDDLSEKLLRRNSEAMLDSFSLSSQEIPSTWEQNHAPFPLDMSQVSSLGLRSPPNSTSPTHKAPLAPKQGSAGSLSNAKAQHQSPVAGTYALRTPRGKITSIACESCRKRKSKCDGVRPKCNTCRSKNLSCVYDVAEDGKTTTQLRAHVRRLVKELDDMKSIVSLLTMAPDKTTALNLASELKRNGFAHHSVEEIKKALQEISEKVVQQEEQELMDASESDTAPLPPQSIATTSSCGSSSREERDSREHSQPALSFRAEHLVVPGPFACNEAYELSKFSFDCAFYRRTKRELLANGWDEEQIFGSHDMDIDSILFPFGDPQDSQPVPTWSSRFVSKILTNSSLPDRLASTFLLTKMMRWLIWPSVDNMNAIPEYLMPLARQDCAAYDLLVDLVPWPQLREHLYKHPEEFMAGAFVGYVRFHWPYGDEACHFWDMESGCTRLTPLFESHINDLSSWRLDPQALELMPHLVELLPIKVE